MFLRSVCTDQPGFTGSQRRRTESRGIYFTWSSITGDGRICWSRSLKGEKRIENLCMEIYFEESIFVDMVVWDDDIKV
jgi:hypothetical protein